jgi:hypothetical protein
MADDIRLVITVENKGVLNAIKSTENLETSVKKLSGTYAREGVNYNKYRKGIETLAKEYGKTDQELRKYANSIRSSNKADKLAKTATDANTKATKALTLARREANSMNARFNSEARSEKLALEQSARASRESANAKRRLRMEFREGYAAQVQYRAAQMRLNEAQRLGVITADQYKVQLAALETQLLKNKAAGVANGERMRATGLVMQQTGYQVGDFLVQVQGGTNAMVAFGQQATQLAGLLTVLGKSTAMIALGATLSVLIPLATAAAGVLLRARREASNTEDSVETLEDRISSATGTLKGFNEQISLLTSGLQDAGELALSEGISSALDNVNELVRALELRELNERTIAGLIASSLTGYDQLTASMEEQVVAAREAVDAAREALDTYRAQRAEAANLALLVERVARAEESRADYIVEYSDLRDQATVYGLIAQYGEQSARVEAERSRQARVAYIISQQEAGFQGAILQSLVDQYDTTQDLKNESKRLSDEMSKVANETERAANAAMSFINNLRSVGSSIPGLEAEIAALEAGGTRGQATAAGAAATARSSDEYQAATGEPILVAALNAEIAAAGLKIEREAILLDRLAELTRTESTAGSGSSGSSLSDQAAEAVASLQAQFTLQEALRGQTEEHILVRRALGDSYSQIGAAQIASLEEQARLIAVVTAADEQRVRINETVANSVGEGLTAMIEGTLSVTDAFKQMARSIIKELYDIFVVQRIVNGITGLMGNLGGGKGAKGVNLKSADGNVFSGGSHIQAYANGGVVDGPTYFPMSGSKTGLMGEAGPEAIMPLKRGSNGKLGVEASGGGSQAINITQNFSFSANGDESVKRIIAEAAPQIANITQKQIMDQRRRGGAMKSTFG